LLFGGLYYQLMITIRKNVINIKHASDRIMSLEAAGLPAKPVFPMHSVAK